MKILHVVHGYPPEFYGGTELYVQRLTQVQQQLGYEPVVLTGTASPGEPGIESFELSGIPVHRLRRNDLFHDRWDRGASGQAGAFFDEFLSSLRPDVVHLHHWIRLSRDLVRRSRAMGVPVVVTCHDLHASCPRIFRVSAEAAFCERELSVENCRDCVPRPEWMGQELVERQVDWFRRDFAEELSYAQALMVPSRALAVALTRFAAVPPGRFELLQHATLVDWPTPQLQPPWTPNRGRPLRLAHWGHLQPSKGVHRILEALPELGDQVELELWGKAVDPEFEERLQQLCAGLPVRRRVDFDQSDLPELAADVAIFASVAYESYSFVVDEAFALGLPLLVSDRGALPERCGDAGLVFAPDDAASLAACIRRILRGDCALADLRAAIPPPRSIHEHARVLKAVYERVRDDTDPVPTSARLPEEGRVLRATESLLRQEHGEREALGHELKNLRLAFSELESSALEGKAQIEALRQEIEAYRQRKVELEADLEQRCARMGEMEQDLAEHRRQLERVRGEYEQVETWLRESKEAEAGLQRWGESLIEENAEASRVVAELRDMARGQGAEIQSIKDELEGLRAEHRCTLEEKAEAERKLEASLVEQKRLRAENRFALPLVLIARLWFRLCAWVRKRL
ncbi:MAG: hypothetical protein CSA62_00525 [Planctomycetota bacterium]|nr:MAG: hypothetical protein CSA62_00525 [Planctomycetota bacterium]